MRLPTKKQIQIAGAAIVALMAMFPPWKYTFSYNSTYSEESAGYNFIVYPPPSRVASKTAGVELDLSRLGLQFVALAAFMAVGLLIAPRATKDDS